MTVSQKCQYALRAVFELARRRGDKPVTVAEIAAAQAIPPRFLEVILVELRKAGIVNSRRGMRGGYQLARDAAALTVGEIITLVDGPVAPVSCVASAGNDDCPLYGRCAFMAMWERARKALSGVYDSTTFQSLIDTEQTGDNRHLGRHI